MIKIGQHLAQSLCKRCTVKLTVLVNASPRLSYSKLAILNKKIQTPTSANHTCVRRHYSRPVVNNTLDEEELKRFQALAKTWWDETGEFEALHAMNRVRIPFIRDGLLNLQDKAPADPCLPLKGFKIVDAGSGGGLLTEPLARLGAFVVGIEPVEESTKVAQLHLMEDPDLLPRVKYICGTIEDLVDTEAETFDAVVASEVLEHVADKVTFVESCCKLVKPGGSLFFTTINRTQMARGMAVFAAEKVLRIVPDGTHDWEKFVPPDDLQKILDINDVHTRKLHGLFYNPLTRRWSFIKNTDINYALHAVKSHHEEIYSVPDDK